MAVLVCDLCQISFWRIDIVDLAAVVVLYTGKKFLVIGIADRPPQGIPDRGDLVGTIGERQGLPGWEFHLSQGVPDIAQPNTVAVEIRDGDKPSLCIIAVDLFLLDCSQAVSIPELFQRKRQVCAPAVDPLLLFRAEGELFQMHVGHHNGSILPVYVDPAADIQEPAAAKQAASVGVDGFIAALDREVPGQVVDDEFLQLSTAKRSTL